jgi:hypothetical protein
MNDELRDSSTGRRSPQGQGEPGLPLGGAAFGSTEPGTEGRGNRERHLRQCTADPVPNWGTLGGALCGSARDARTMAG